MSPAEVEHLVARVVTAFAEAAARGDFDKASRFADILFGVGREALSTLIGGEDA